jgi:uncharacterized protein YyaL (SSP411 family)
VFVVDRRVILPLGLALFIGLPFAWGQESPAPVPNPPEAPKTPAAGPKAPPHGKSERRMNRLGKEKSPYLLQHAYNPVDWYPWGDEAFTKAEKENKPVFLSIGYSTCHWCHVMERESFENEAIAAYLNEHFVAIKVDREERPDVDAVYMAVTQQMTGSGGWPMSVFLTPARKPFFAGTYFPPQDRFGRPGFRTLLGKVSDAWTERRDEVVASSEQITRALAADKPTDGSSELSPTELMERGYRVFKELFDPDQGGFGGRPKFPRPHTLLFLLRHWKRTGDAHALHMVETTLDAMARGGLHDHVGGGFHRYSTDRFWLLPHFEKMLYDQAMLARAYTEAYQATGNPRHMEVAKDIFRYVLRDMTSPQGGFFSAEDADSEGIEGKFYVWAFDELIEVLGEEKGPRFARVYGAKPEGNFHDEASGESTEENILHLKAPLTVAAKEAGMLFGTLEKELEQARAKLFEVRKRRIPPLKDDKVLTDWNGLMIGAFAEAARAFDEPAYLRAATKAADFVLKTLRRKDGRLLHRYRDGEAAIPAHLEDYAYLIDGLTRLYEAGFDTRYLEAAQGLARDMIRLFSDEKRGGFYMSGSDAEILITRTMDLYDGARPSGNSVAMLALLRLGRLTADTALEEQADRSLKAFSARMAQGAHAFPYALTAVDFAAGPSREVVIAGTPGAKDTQALLNTLNRRYEPNKVVALHPPSKTGEATAIEKLAPYLKDQVAQEGKATAYVCSGYACQQPVTSPAALEELLEGLVKAHRDGSKLPGKREGK